MHNKKVLYKSESVSMLESNLMQDCMGMQKIAKYFMRLKKI